MQPLKTGTPLLLEDWAARKAQRASAEHQEQTAKKADGLENVDAAKNQTRKRQIHEHHD